MTGPPLLARTVRQMGRKLAAAKPSKGTQAATRSLDAGWRPWHVTDHAVPLAMTRRICASHAERRRAGDLGEDGRPGQAVGAVVQRVVERPRVARSPGPISHRSGERPI